MTSLKDKVAVVTGGSSGIGFAIAQIFIEAGARVMIVARQKASVDEATRRLGDQATGLAGDLADPATHDVVAQTVRNRFGAADIYVANAGTIRVSAAADVSLDDYDAQFDANTRAAFFGVQKIAPVLRDGGRVLLTSSIATRKLLEGHSVYAGSKAAIEAFARAWAVELAPRRIRVNVLSPGPTDTPILDKLAPAPEARAGLEAGVSSTIPFGRLGRPADLAAAALFLVSDEAAFITGVNLPVDGGLSAT